jgi:hypothetical protein
MGTNLPWIRLPEVPRLPKIAEIETQIFATQRKGMEERLDCNQEHLCVSLCLCDSDLFSIPAIFGNPGTFGNRAAGFPR